MLRSLLSLLCILVLAAAPARAELVVDIGGPSLGDTVFITPGGFLDIDVTISSTTGTEMLRTAFMSFLIEPPLTGELPRSRLRISDLTPTSTIVDDPAYLFFDRSNRDFFVTEFPQSDGIQIDDEGLVDHQGVPMTQSQSFLLARFRLQHDLNGFSVDEVIGESFEIRQLIPFSSEIDGPFFDANKQPLVAWSSNTLTVTAIPEAGTLAFCLLCVTGLGGVSVYRNRKKLQ